MGPLGIGLGINVALRAPVLTSTPTIVISGALAQGILGQAYAGAGLTVTPPGSKTKVSTADAAMLASFGLTWNQNTHKPEGVVS